MIRKEDNEVSLTLIRTDVVPELHATVGGGVVRKKHPAACGAQCVNVSVSFAENRTAVSVCCACRVGKLWTNNERPSTALCLFVSCPW